MRLAILNQYYTPDISPTAHLCASLAEHRAGLGDEVTVVASRGGYATSGSDGRSEVGASQPGVRVHRLWTSQLGKRKLWRRAADYLSFYLLAAWRLAVMPPQDVVVALTTPPFIAWAGVLHKLLHPRARLVLWNMDCYPEVAERAGVIRPGGTIGRLLRALNRGLFRRLDHLVCLDEAMRELLLSQYDPPMRSLGTSVIPNWEPLCQFAEPARRGEWDGPDAQRLCGKFVIVYTGNAGRGHAFDTALAAALAMNGEPVVFWFVGGGAARAGIEQFARRHALSTVLFHDYLPKSQMPRVMAAADAALVTLRDEMLGVMSPSKLHASLAMGLPILYVGPAESNVDSALARFGCGTRLRHGMVGELVASVRRLMQDRAEHARQRRAARTAFETAYCGAASLRQFDDLLAATIGERRASLAEPRRRAA